MTFSSYCKVIEIQDLKTCDPIFVKHPVYMLYINCVWHVKNVKLYLSEAKHYIFSMRYIIYNRLY